MFNHERLVLARHRRGLNKTQLAKAIGVTLQTLSSYERGNSEPTPALIERLAEVLAFPPSFFFSDLTDSVLLDAASFRKLSRMTARQRDSALAGGTQCVELNAWMEENFELPTPDVPDLDPGVISPEGAAAMVRSQWGLGDVPIGNVLQMVEAHGVRVFSLVEECREIDAFSFWQDGVPFICLGAHKTAERAVFDVAHELGHLVLHRDHSAPRGRAEERQADDFAANLLMPKSEIDAYAPRFPTYADLVSAKTRWRVSVMALAYRLHNLGWITDWHFRSLCIEIAKKGREIEPNSIPREQSQVLAKVLKALRAEGSGKADIANALNYRTSDIDALMDGLTVSSIAGEGESTPSSPPRLRVV